MIAAILALGISAFSFEAGGANPPPDGYVCQAAVIRMGASWCDGEACETIQPPEDVECVVTGGCAYAAHDPEPGEVLFIWIRALSQGVASPVCTHDGGVDDCGTPEHVEDTTICP